MRVVSDVERASFVCMHACVLYHICVSQEMVRRHGQPDDEVLLRGRAIRVPERVWSLPLRSSLGLQIFVFTARARMWPVPRLPALGNAFLLADRRLHINTLFAIHLRCLLQALGFDV